MEKPQEKVESLASQEFLNAQDIIYELLSNPLPANAKDLWYELTQLREELNHSIYYFVKGAKMDFDELEKQIFA